jgi:glycosyltransferase involved in cell wall biosynthesis
MTENRARRGRVAMIAASYPGNDDAVRGVFVRDQAEILADRYDVAVIAPRTVVVSRRPRSWPAVLSVLQRRESRATVSDGSLSTFRPLSFAMFRAPDATERSFERGVIRALRARWTSGKPDLLHAHVVLPAGLAAVRVGSALGVPTILTEHSSPFSAHLRTPESRRSVQEALHGASRVIAVGWGLRDEIVEVAPVSVDVVGNVVAPVFFEAEPHPVRPGSALRLLGVGFLTPQKRFDVLLDAVSHVRADEVSLELVIVGDGRDGPALRAQAERLGIAGRVRLVPMGSRTEVLRWLEWCDVLVSTSDHESFGLVVAEALATGRPVVTTASGGPEGFVDADTGLIVPRGDVPAIAAAITDLPRFLSGFDPAVARRRMADRFGPDVFLERMTAIYDEVLAASHGGVGGSPPPGREPVP